MLLAVKFKVLPTHIGPLLPGTGSLKSQVLQNFCQVLPSQILMQLVEVFKIIKPKSGALIESRWACERRGIKKPLLVKLTSSPAEAAGGLPLGLKLTPPIWQNAVALMNINKEVKNLFIHYSLN